MGNCLPLPFAVQRAGLIVVEHPLVQIPAVAMADTVMKFLRDICWFMFPLFLNIEFPMLNGRDERLAHPAFGQPGGLSLPLLINPCQQFVSSGDEIANVLQT